MSISVVVDTKLLDSNIKFSEYTPLYKINLSVTIQASKNASLILSM
jgi:hypothetical protein